MSKQLPNDRIAQDNPVTGDVVEKLRRSRQRLLDLTLRNRLLNFRAGNPNYHDDLKAHKHAVLKGHMDSLWQTLVEEGKHIEVACLTRDQQMQIVQELRLQSGPRSQPSAGAGFGGCDAR